MPRSPYTTLLKDEKQNVADMVPGTQIAALLRRAGIKQHQAEAAQYLREEVFPLLICTVVEDAVRLMDYAGRGKKKTVTSFHVREGVKYRFGKRIY